MQHLRRHGSNQLQTNTGNTLKQRISNNYHSNNKNWWLQW